MPGGPDALVMLLSWQRPAMMPIFALTAALGSVLGCYILYLVGRKGGDVALSRFSPERRDRVMAKMRKNDILAVFVAVIGPPPFPTKVFILTAGAIHMSWKRFVAAVFAGRMMRFTAEGYLGARFGDEAAEILAEYYPAILIALLVGATFIIAIRYFMQSRPADAA
jgi:membrane protein YqaA with SNARE-associated domain